MGMVQVAASSKSFCLVPKYLMIEDSSTLALGRNAADCGALVADVAEYRAGCLEYLAASALPFPLAGRRLGSRSRGPSLSVAHPLSPHYDD